MTDSDLYAVIGWAFALLAGVLFAREPFMRFFSTLKERKDVSWGTVWWLIVGASVLLIGIIVLAATGGWVGAAIMAIGAFWMLFAAYRIWNEQMTATTDDPQKEVIELSAGFTLIIGAVFQLYAIFMPEG